jgi:hypothetical protein
MGYRVVAARFGVTMEKQATLEAIGNEELLSLKRQVASLTELVEQMRQQLARQSEMMAKLSPANGSGEPPAHEKPVSPEILVVIAAAVSSFLGKKIRIRSARMMQTPYEIVNPWSQQGRVSVQASHWLRHER